MQQVRNDDDAQARARHQGDAEQNGFRRFAHKEILERQRRFRPETKFQSRKVLERRQNRWLFTKSVGKFQSG
jgi:hypothetical protein